MRTRRLLPLLLLIALAITPACVIQQRSRKAALTPDEKTLARTLATNPRQIDFMRPGSQKFALHIENPFQEDLEIALEWRKAPFRWHISPDTAKRILLPGASADIACQVLYIGEGGNPHLTPEAVIRATAETVGTLIVRRELAATRSHSVPMMAQPIAVDALLDEWDDVPPIVLDLASQMVWISDDEKWDGPRDLRAKVYLSRDDQNLYIAAKVHDDTDVRRYVDERIMRGDSMTVAIRCSQKAPAGADVHVITLARTPHGHTLWRQHDVAGAPAGEILGPPVKVQHDVLNLVTVYEAALPFSVLPGLSGAERVIEASVIVCDDDGKGLEGYARWTPGILPIVDPDYFGKIFFERP